jgi:hypothetical protein
VKTWRLVYLSTGEVDLDAKLREGGKRGAMAGQTVRMPTLRADAGAGLGAFQALHGEADGAAFAERLEAAARRLHGTAGPAFVERLAELRAADPESLAARLNRRMEAFAERLTAAGSDGQVRRLARNFALLAVAGEEATELGVLPWPPGEAFRGVAACFRGLIEQRGGLGRAEDRAALEQVRAFLERHGEARFQGCDGEVGAIPVRDRAGFRRRDGDVWEYFILPGAWRDEVCRGLDPAAAAKALEQAGCLVRDPKGKHRARSIRLPGLPAKSRVYHVPGRIFEIADGGDDEWPPTDTDRADASAHEGGAGGSGGAAAVDPVRGLGFGRNHPGTTAPSPAVVPPHVADAAHSRAISLGETTGTTGTTSDVVGSGNRWPARLQPSWSDPSIAPVPGSICGRCGGATWWTERTDPKGWRCSRCHPPTGLDAGDVREVCAP